MSASGEDLRNSRPLDVHRWSERPEVKVVVDHLFPELFGNLPRQDSIEIRKRHLRVVVLDLWHCYLEDPLRYLGISLNRNAFAKAKRYDELHIDYVPFAHVVSVLGRAGYVEMRRGFKDRRTGSGFQTRIRATEKLTRLLAASSELAPAAMETSGDIETVVLRDENKNEIDYEDTEETIAMRDVLRTYNALLKRTYIDIQLRGYHNPVSIDLSNKTVRRIFNNGDWGQGGRFYGGWWQGLPKELRRRIVIRDKPTREIDYRGLHVVVLYALKGIDYFRDVDDDPYTLKGYDYSAEAGEKYRDLFKLILLCALNASDSTSALRAVQSDLNQDKGNQYPEGIKLKDALDSFVTKHKAIAEFFFKQNALQLQNLDAAVAARVIAQMTAKSSPVLCIHDSFVCMRADVDVLKTLLASELNGVLRERGGKAIAAELKTLEDFFKPEDEQFVSDDLEMLLTRRLDKDQLRRFDSWNKEQVQYPIQYLPPDADDAGNEKKAHDARDRPYPI